MSGLEGPAAWVRKWLSALVMLPVRVLVFSRFAPPVGKVIRDVRYDHSDSRKQSLDVVVPRVEPPYPVLVFIHGGGFHSLDKNVFTRVAKSFAHEGFLVFNINYRLAPKNTFPDQLEDVGSAVWFAYEAAARFGGDNARMFLAGDSCGAYLAAMYSAAVASPELAPPLSIERLIPAKSLRGQLLFYGAFDLDTVLDTMEVPDVEFITSVFLGKDPVTYRERAEAASPMRHVGAGYTPSFICSSERDQLHVQSVDFERALTAAGAPHETCYLADGDFDRAPHGFLPLYFLRCTRVAMGEALSFLERLA